MKRREQKKGLADREEGIKVKENERLPTKLWCRHSALRYLPFERLGERRKRNKGEEGFEKGDGIGESGKGITAEMSGPR